MTTDTLETIGNQVWMVENLKATHFADGTPINLVGKGDWYGYPFAAYGDYLENPVWSASYGRLYNWAAVMDPKGLAPEGWLIPNTGATDEFGFAALPGGYRGDGGHEGQMQTAGYYWTSSIHYGEVFEFDAYFRIFDYHRTEIFRGHIPKGTGISVRCIKESK